MAWEQDLMAEITTLVDTTWPTLGRIFRGREAGFINWRTPIEDFLADTPDGAYPPFAVIQWGAMMPSTKYGDVNSAYEFPVSVYFVVPTVAADRYAESSTSLQTQIANALELMRAAFHADGVLWQTEMGPIMDQSQAMEANSVFTELMLPLRAGVVRATLICGVSP